MSGRWTRKNYIHFQFKERRPDGYSHAFAYTMGEWQHRRTQDFPDKYHIRSLWTGTGEVLGQERKA